MRCPLSGKKALPDETLDPGYVFRPEPIIINRKWGVAGPLPEAPIGSDFGLFKSRRGAVPADFDWAPLFAETDFDDTLHWPPTARQATLTVPLQKPARSSASERQPRAAEHRPVTHA